MSTKRLPSASTRSIVSKTSTSTTRGRRAGARSPSVPPRSPRSSGPPSRCPPRRRHGPPPGRGDRGPRPPCGARAVTQSGSGSVPRGRRSSHRLHDRATRGRERSRIVTCDGPQQPPHRQSAQRGEGVAGIAGQPGGAAQAHRVGAGPEVLAAVVHGPDPAGRDDRQGDPGVAQLGDHPQPDRLDRPAGQAAEPVGQQGLPGAGVEPQRLDGVDGGEPGHARAGGLGGVAQVVVVRRELEQHGMVAARHRLVEHVLQDRGEVEVDVVARDVELDGRDVARRNRGVDPVDQGHELLGGEPAEGDDRPLVAGAGVVVAQVGVDADVAPAEGVDEAGVGAAQHGAVAAQQAGQLAQRPPVAGGEVPLAGLHGEGPGGDGAELGQGHEQRHGAHAVRHERGVGHAVAEQAGRGHHPVAQHDVADPHALSRAGAGAAGGVVRVRSCGMSSCGRPVSRCGARPDATCGPNGRRRRRTPGRALPVWRPGRSAASGTDACAACRARSPRIASTARMPVDGLHGQHGHVLVVRQVQPRPRGAVGERHRPHQLPGQVPRPPDVADLHAVGVRPHPRAGQQQDAARR